MDEYLIPAVTAFVLLFSLYELFKGEVYARGLRAFSRREHPFRFWLTILFQFAVVGVLAFAWLSGVR